MRKCHSNLLGVCLLGAGISAAAHCPTHIINSSDKPWILASAQIQETLKIRVLHTESGGPLAQGIFSSGQGGYFIMPAHSIIGIEALDGAVACEAQFMLLDHKWDYPTEGVLTYAAPAASGGPEPTAGSLRFSVPEAGRDVASITIREPTSVILQILRDAWDRGPSAPDAPGAASAPNQAEAGR
ncbi:MAG: hypothetical protein P4L36_04935 [Holophaga sp.]|nr:hypothetical protein [Holophaga sp.]